MLSVYLYLYAVLFVLYLNAMNLFVKRVIPVYNLMKCIASLCVHKCINKTNIAFSDTLNTKKRILHGAIGKFRVNQLDTLAFKKTRLKVSFLNLKVHAKLGIITLECSVIGHMNIWVYIFIMAHTHTTKFPHPRFDTAYRRPQSRIYCLFASYYILL